MTTIPLRLGLQQRVMPGYRVAFLTPWQQPALAVWAFFTVNHALKNPLRPAMNCSWLCPPMRTTYISFAAGDISVCSQTSSPGLKMAT